jgi:hypothetical protein
MKITPLTPRDDTLAGIASDLATKLFPDLAGDWKIGCFQHLTILESRLLFLGSDQFFQIGRISRLAVPGAPPLLWARAWNDYAQAVRGHAVSCNLLGLAETEKKYVLVDDSLDPATDAGRAVLAHELCHGAASSFPPHSIAWRERLRRAAEAARALDDDDLACSLDKSWKRYRPGPDAPADCESPAVYLNRTCDEWTAAASRHRIVLSDGTLLSDWLRARRAAGWGAET